MWERRGVVWCAVDFLFITCLALVISYLVLLRCLADPNPTDEGLAGHCLARGGFFILYMLGIGLLVACIVALPS